MASSGGCGTTLIRGTSRTTFNRAAGRRMVPPDHADPFRRFPIETPKDPTEERTAGKVFTADWE